MNLEKYKNDGWGLSVLGFSNLLELLKNNNNDSIRVLEFGSGISTQFFCDVVKENIKKLEITSFDNDINFSYKKTKDDDFLSLLIRPLVECDNNEYNKQMESKEYDSNVMYNKISPLNPLQKNNFYKIENGDLNGVYDIIVLDGPNGNGRNFAFLHIKNYLKPGSIIYIDDYNHYDFLEKCLDNIDCDIIIKHTEGIGSDNFVIVKVK
jgi:hypothetical protein